MLQSLLLLTSMILGYSVSDNDTAINHNANVAVILVAQLIPLILFVRENIRFISDVIQIKNLQWLTVTFSYTK